MLTDIVGLGMQAVGAIYGGAKNAQAYSDLKASIANQKAQDTDWYDRRYNEDGTQRGDAQRLIALTEDSIRNRNKYAAGQDAMSGGVGLASAKAREQNNQAIAQTVSQINADSAKRADVIEQTHQANQKALTAQNDQLTAQKMAGTAQAMMGVSDAAGSMFGLSAFQKA